MRVYLWLVLFIILTAVVFGLALPALISAPSDVSVLIGIGIIFLYPLVAWQIVKRFGKAVKAGFMIVSYILLKIIIGK